MDYGLGLSPQQQANAQAIIAVGKARGASMRDIEVAESVAITESGLQNYANANNPESLALPHDAVGSDHGSVGVFQQQVGGAPNSTANWGTTSQLMNVRTAASKFFDALFKIGNRDSMNPWNEGQAVQGSAFSDGSNYQQSWQRGKQIADALYTGTPAGAVPVSGGATAAPVSWLSGAGTVASGLVPGLSLLGVAANNLDKKGKGIFGSIQTMGVKMIFILGGAGLVVLGAKQLAQPTIDRARDQAQQAAGAVAKAA